MNGFGDGAEMREKKETEVSVVEVEARALYEASVAFIVTGTPFENLVGYPAEHWRAKARRALGLPRDGSKDDGEGQISLEMG